MDEKRQQAKRQQDGIAFASVLLAELSNVPLIRELWQHFPENMFLIRVEDDGGFVVEAANPAQIEAIGRECLGRRLHDFMPAASADGIVQRYQACVERNAPMRYEESVAFYDPDGGAESFGHWLTLVVPLHHDEDSERVTHLFGISQDVTELHLTRLALERQNQRLETRVDERTAELCAANEELKALNARLEEMATRDFLTGAYNRRHLETLAAREMQRAERHGSPLCLMMVDLDDFKRINDTQGHAVGDDVLKQVVDKLYAELRSIDVIGRYGGDEFVVLLPGAQREEALVVAERLRQSVDDACTVSISLGVAEFRQGDHSLDVFVQRADRELLAAKRGGRNRVM